MNPIPFQVSAIILIVVIILWILLSDPIKAQYVNSGTISGFRGTKLDAIDRIKDSLPFDPQSRISKFRKIAPKINLNNFQWAEYSPLSQMGYHVGATHDICEEERRAILSLAMIVSISDEFIPEYLHSWGEPLSQIRYQRTIGILKS